MLWNLLFKLHTYSEPEQQQQQQQQKQQPKLFSAELEIIYYVNVIN